MSYLIWVWFGLFVLGALGYALRLYFERVELLAARPEAAELMRVVMNAKDEAVLLGPVSAWVAEGEARAVGEWDARIGHRATTEAIHDLLNRPLQPDCDDCEWVDDTALGDTARHYLRGLACARHQPRDPDLPSPMREAEWR